MQKWIYLDLPKPLIRPRVWEPLSYSPKIKFLSLRGHLHSIIFLVWYNLYQWPKISYIIIDKRMYFLKINLDPSMTYPTLCNCFSSFMLPIKWWEIHISFFHFIIVISADQKIQILPTFNWIKSLVYVYELCNELEN